MLDDGEILEVFKKTKELSAIAQVHAENGHVIDQVLYCTFRVFAQKLEALVQTNYNGIFNFFIYIKK